MKKQAFICAGFFALLIGGCVTTKYIPDRNLIEDPQFANWFNIRGLGGDVDDGKNQGVFPSAEKIGKPSWSIAQWGSRHNLADPKITKTEQLSPHVFQISNASKLFKVNSLRGELEMGLFASACNDAPRAQGEPWPHLLVSAPLVDVRVPSGFCKVENIKQLNLTLNCQLLSFKDNHPNPDPALHAAQFLLHLYVQNLTKDDDGFGDMLWFQVPIFDNRHVIIEEKYKHDNGKPDASGKFIFTMAHKVLRSEKDIFFKNGAVEAGEESKVIPTQAELIPWIHYAFQMARKQGFMQTTSFRDLYISGINLGWEMPGTYDATMRVSNLSLTAAY
ncbi:MAG: hypothetical protein PHO37_18140 [Kiritimatiellae bacterium]|nr:hypothetical protein [Kiritimatiellia bacterium]